MKVIDLWEQLQSIFEGQDDEYPEIDIVDLQPAQLGACLSYLFETSRECSFQFRLRENDKVMVIVPSPHIAIQALIAEEIVGAMMFSFPPMPALVVYASYADTLTLSFGRSDWDALRVVMLFDLISRLLALSPGSRIVPDDVNFTYPERVLFMEMW